MYRNNESFEKYKVTLNSREQARKFRDIVFGFWKFIRENESANPYLKLSVQKLCGYLDRDDVDNEFDFDGLMIGYRDTAFLPEKRYGWALDIHDIAIVIMCLSVTDEEAQELLQDIVDGIVCVYSDPSASLKTEIGLNYGPFIQFTEEIEDDRITEDHVRLALDRIYRGQGVTDFDRKRYTHPSHEITDPKVFVSSIVANVEVEGLGSTLSYIYDKLVELGVEEIKANREIIVNELVRMSTFGLDRPMVMLGASGIEETLLVECGREPNPQSKLADAINIAYSKNIISKDVGYACSIIREVRNDLGHSSWPSAKIGPQEIALTSSLVILILKGLLDTTMSQTAFRDIGIILEEFESIYNWEVRYEDGCFKVEMP